MSLAPIPFILELKYPRFSSGRNRDFSSFEFAEAINFCWSENFNRGCSAKIGLSVELDRFILGSMASGSVLIALFSNS